MAGDNEADGKECVKQPWTDKDYKQPDSYQPGPGSSGGGASSAKEEAAEGE